MLPDELKGSLEQVGLPRYRVEQIFAWIHKHAVQGPDEMKNLPVDLRQRLKEMNFSTGFLLQRQVSSDGTEKFLWSLQDGHRIESVLMPYSRDHTRDRVTVCISSQVGCALGCGFCATGQGGFQRNLTAGEIVGQVLDITAIKRREDKEFKVTNVVYMGMGEPFLNYEAMKKSILLLAHTQGQSIGQRRISVSTAGVVPGIKRFAEEGWEINLALSLHATTQEQRQSIMPIAQRYPLEELLDACSYYWNKTRRRLTVEYAVVAGKNDSAADAERLARIFKKWPIHLNVIPVNPVKGTGLARPAREDLTSFVAALQTRGVNAVLREERGSDIDAACGQLRALEARVGGDINAGICEDRNWSGSANQRR